MEKNYFIEKNINENKKYIYISFQKYIFDTENVCVTNKI